MSLLAGVLIGGVLAWWLVLLISPNKFSSTHRAGQSPAHSAVPTPLPPGVSIQSAGGSFPADLYPAAKKLAEYVRACHDERGTWMAEGNGELKRALTVVEHEVMRREVRERVKRRSR